MNQPSLFSRPSAGTCLFCSSAEPVLVIAPTMFSSMDRKPGPAGVCDVCSYALRHAWQLAQGERIAAVSPHLVRTYMLVPRLPKDREALDVSAYEFLVDGNGGLPYVEISTAEGLRSPCYNLWRYYAISSWRETMRPCYLGYSGSADFSEVLLTWAWGKSLTPVRGLEGAEPCRFANFATLLGKPTPDAGFYLGVKAAFESFLWKHEVDPESNPVSVVMREPAMRYLKKNFSPSFDRDQASGDMDDPSMIELCRAAMTTEERAVANLLEGVAKSKSPSMPDLKNQGGTQTAEAKGNRPEESAGEGSSEDNSGDQGEEDRSNDDQSADTSIEGLIEGAIEPGFARPKHSLDR